MLNSSSKSHDCWISSDNLLICDVHFDQIILTLDNFVKFFKISQIAKFSIHFKCYELLLLIILSMHLQFLIDENDLDI